MAQQQAGMGPLAEAHVNLQGNTRFRERWDQLRSSYWFVPSLLVVGAVVLAIVLIALDQHFRFDQRSGPTWLFLGKAESARSILATVATAMITVVSLTFSMTVVVLTLASSQFGPRLLYNFMRDRSNQIALGVFVACFVFCLLVLRTVQGGDATGFVPQLSTNAAIVFAVLSVGVLIHFIHHIADSIQASTVIANVRHELESIVTRMIPQANGRDSLDRSEWRRLSHLVDEGAARITARKRGVLQAVDCDTLVAWAQEHDALLRLNCRPGDFVILGNLLFEAFPAERIGRDRLAALQDAFSFGRRRTLVQDIEFAFQQLVEIAVRALSPGINDPFTAIACVSELGSGLALVARRGEQSPIVRDADGKPRVLLKAVDFEGLADVAFNQIRQNGATHPAVMIRMLETIADVAQALDRPRDRSVLLRHATAIHTAARDAAHDSGDRADIDRRFERASQLLGGPGAQRT